MPIEEVKKTVFRTSDGKEHTHRHLATRHEAHVTLQALGLKPETAARLLGMGVDTMRAIAATLDEYAGVREEDARRREERLAEAQTANEDPSGGIGAWPADANVAPRPGERTKEQLDAAKARLRDDMYGGTDD